MFKCTKVITPGNSIIVSTLGSKSKSAPVNHPCLSSPGSGTTPLLLILSGPGPLYLRGEGPFTLALEQLMCYSPSVALDLYISGVRGSGTVPVLLTLSSPGPLYLQVRGHLLWFWNSSSITHPQWPWPSVSPEWGAAYSGSGTALVSGWGSRRSAEDRCRSVKRRACWALIMSRSYGGKQRDITLGPEYNEHLATANK